MKFIIKAIIIFGFLSYFLLFHYTPNSVTTTAFPYYLDVQQNDTHDIYLNDTIEDENSYLQLFSFLENADKDTQVNLHVTGYGGNVDTMLYFASAIEKSKAHITTIVEGPVYSADAIIAMMGQKIIISNNVLFMFHEPAVTDPKTHQPITMEQYCRYVKGSEDRGQDGFIKCMDNAKYNGILFHNLFSKYVAMYLTRDEQIRVFTGHDVYILGSELKRRIQSSPLQINNRTP